MKPYTKPFFSVLLSIIGGASIAFGAFALLIQTPKINFPPATAFSAIFSGLLLMALGSALDHLRASAYWAEYTARTLHGQTNSHSSSHQGSAYGRMG